MASPYSETALGATERSLSGILVELEGEAAAMLDAAGRNYEGDTKQSLYHETAVAGAVVRGAFGAGSAHAIFAHEGRRPGKWPPVAPIRRWLQRKLAAPEEGLDYAVFRLREKIGREGTRGTPFLREPFEAKRPEIAPRIARDVAAALNSAEIGRSRTPA